MKQVISAENAPKAIGSYSQAINVQGTVYLSGQIPLVPETMELVSTDFTAQARQVFKNLAAVCEAAGGDLQRVVKLNIYLTDLSYFPDINNVMKEFIQEPYPARAAVGVKELPKGALVEADGILCL